MMISPEAFANQYRGCSLMELAVRRDELRYKIRDLRKKGDTEWLSNGEAFDMLPDERAEVQTLYLEALDELIATREAEEGGSIDNLDAG